MEIIPTLSGSMPPFAPGPGERTNRIRSSTEPANQERSLNHYPPQSQSQKPSSWRTFRTGPALDRVRRQKKKERPNERGIEGTDREKKGGIRFSNKGGKQLLSATQLISTSSNNFLQLSLFRTVLETHRQPLTPTPPQSHRKNILPKP